MVLACQKTSREKKLPDGRSSSLVLSLKNITAVACALLHTIKPVSLRNHTERNESFVPASAFVLLFKSPSLSQESVAIN